MPLVAIDTDRLDVQCTCSTAPNPTPLQVENARPSKGDRIQFDI